MLNANEYFCLYILLLFINCFIYLVKCNYCYVLLADRLNLVMQTTNSGCFDKRYFLKLVSWLNNTFPRAPRTEQNERESTIFIITGPATYIILVLIKLI